MTQQPRRALVVDDEPALVELVRGYLEHDGFEVRTASDGPTALDTARRFVPDVTILDLGLPLLDGIEVCRELRRFSDCYVIMLTARTDEVDTLVGLSVGADDYLTKPFSPRELVARVKVMLRRPRQIPATHAGTSLRFGPLEIDLAAREARIDGQIRELTVTEFNLLAVLARQPNVALTRRQLVEAVWSDEWIGDERLVDVHIGHLRRKLGDDAGAPRFVRTIRGVGYRMGTGE
ncbi:response regulator transcription factor [Skermania sp. ID1734]|uniref:response regulator transcription factor n=1 Tax=Skermania sp. ID1734 TaxID=2597516 RepID=UPI00117F228C|nr:response regulator transcription factor [Skermania sp. ID1734]TSD98157.1 response regulator transcription factor [Skermania sp. ID1734]